MLYWIGKRRVLCSLIFWSVLFFTCPVLAAGHVDEVAAEVDSSAPIPALVQGRMQMSVQAIAEQLLSGRSLSDLTAHQTQDEATIHEVFDKVLVGYSVQQVEIVPGERTVVHVRLLPWRDVIRQTRVDISVEGMPPEVEALVRKDLQGVDEVFRQSLDGLPLAAADWTNGVLKHSLNDFMEQHLPEFRADFDVDPERDTVVRLVVYPRLPVVRTVDLNMRSSTVPNFTLLNHRELMQEKADLLIGVPVAFLARHEEAFRQMLEQALDSTADFRAYAMHTQVGITIGENVTLMSRSDTTRYRWRLEGWADVHHDQKAGQNKDIRFRMHMGQMLSPTDEFFIFSDFYPQDIRWEWSAGIRHRVLMPLWLEIRYDMTHQRFAAGLSDQLGRRWQLRYEYRWFDQQAEFGLRYKMHDFLSLEYVRDKEDSWLRFIGDF